MKIYSHDKESVIVTILLIYLFSYLICSAVEIQKQLQYSRTFEQSRKVQTMGVHRHGQERAFALPWKCCKVFLCCKVQSIYALFSVHVVSFWGLNPRPPPGFHPWIMLGNFHPPDPLICPPLEKILQAPMVETYTNSCSNKHTHKD